MSIWNRFCVDFNYFENRPSEQLHSYFLPCYKPIGEKKYKFILFLELACQKRGVIMDVLHFHRRLVPDRRATSLTFGFVSFSDFLRVWKTSSLSFCRRGSLVLELLSSSFLFLFCSYWVLVGVIWVRDFPTFCCLFVRSREQTLMPYPCSHFYSDIKFGDRLYCEVKFFIIEWNSSNQW